MVTAAALATLVACAAGAEGTGSDDDPIDAARIDAPNNPNVDARVDAPSTLPDARLIDAPSALPDAGVDLGDAGGLFCNSNAECTIAGQCCFQLVPGSPGFCVDGTVDPILMICLPAS